MGVKLSDKGELNFHCKANKNKKDISKKIYCVKSESYGAVKSIWGNPKAKPYDVDAFGCDSPSKYCSGGKDKKNKNKDKYNGGVKDKDKDKYNGDKDKNKYPKPTQKPYQPPTKKPYQ